MRSGAELARGPSQLPQSLTSVTTRAHPSVRALALLLAERIARDILQEHAQTESASAAAAEHGQPASGGEPLLKDINPCKTFP